MEPGTSIADRVAVRQSYGLIVGETRPGAQTERRCGAGPVGGLLGVKDLTGRLG
jgi:hypothetical protein